MNRAQLNRLLAEQMPDCYNVFPFPSGEQFTPNVVIIRGGQPYTALDISGPATSAQEALQVAYAIAMHHRQIMFIENATMIVFQNGPIIEGQINWPWQ